jgi:hypothetical protein
MRLNSLNDAQFGNHINQWYTRIRWFDSVFQLGVTPFYSKVFLELAMAKYIQLNIFSFSMAAADSKI